MLTHQVPGVAASSTPGAAVVRVDTPSWTGQGGEHHHTCLDGIPSGACCLAGGAEHSVVKRILVV